MTVTVRLLPAAEHLPSAVRGIYLEAFPASEREPWLELVTGHADGAQVVYLAEDAGQPVGFAVVQPLTASLPMALLAYLAVRHDRRGEGIGALLIDTIRAQAPAAGWERGLVLEVEPATAADPDERTRQERRLGFYRRLGAVDELDVAYAMPDFDTGQPLPMHLLTLPVGVDAGLPVTEIVRAIYRHVYPFHDEVLTRVLDGTADDPAWLASEDGGPTVDRLRALLGLPPADPEDTRIDEMLADPDAYYAAAHERAERAIWTRVTERRYHNS